MCEKCQMRKAYQKAYYKNNQDEWKIANRKYREEQKRKKKELEGKERVHLNSKWNHFKGRPIHKIQFKKEKVTLVF